MSHQILFGLTEEEAAQLESDDEEFYGLSEQPLLASASGDDLESEGEELGDRGILPECELQERISIAARENREEESLASTITSVGLVSQENDPVYSAINRRLNDGCSCADACLTQFTADEVYRFHLSLYEMTKSEKEMLILGKLHAITKSSDSVQHARQSKPRKRKRVTCGYCFDDRLVCKDGFLFLHDLGTKQLKNLQKHLRANGPVPREHGLVGHMPATTYPFEVVSDGAHFIRNFAECYGIPQPAARSGRASNPPIYLPASLNYKIVHSKYVEACQLKDTHVRFLAYKSFVNMWKRCLADIVFMTPRTDVCAVCEGFRIQLKDATREEEKVKLTAAFTTHLEAAQEERDYYLTSMKQAETTLADNCGTPLEYAHYTFDFAQCVHIPHHARQVGPLYFKTPRKIQIFGICCDSNRKQHNYLIDEDNSIGTNGANTHGPNSVISMLDHYFRTHNLHETRCHLHCDNCVGQNKNNYVIGYLAWRTITGKHQEITLSFMRVGHTRCLVDGHFGLIKKIYRQSDTDTLSQMAEVVQRSSTNNIAQLYSWEWRKWDSFCQKMFNRIPLITKYQHFRFSSSTPGIVYVRTSCSAEEKPIKIFKKKVTAATVKRARLPPLIPPAGLTDERRKYLYEQIRPFVSPQYQDITCPPL